MIINFEVSNYKSIYRKVSFSMLPTKLRENKSLNDNIFSSKLNKNISILKSAVIYGPNASGKSNIVDSLSFFKNFILNSTNLKLNQKIPFNPFKLLTVALQEPTSFNLEFMIDGIVYEYGYSINNTYVLEEHLTMFTSRKPTEVFKREYGEPIKFSSTFKGEKKSLESQLLDNHLLLTKGANSKFEQLEVVYTYFQGKLNIFSSDFDDNFYSLRKAYEDEHFRKNIIEFLYKADTGIDSLHIQKRDIENENIQFTNPSIPIEIKENILEKLSFKANILHKQSSSEGNPDSNYVEWDLAQESVGTQKLFALAGPIIDILENGSVLIFDELTNSLHPLISKFIIELFNNPEKNLNGAQLIFTTHDITLLDNTIFRRDQIWLTEKKLHGYTDLNSLHTFDVRKDIPIDKWYLSGRFGALPITENYYIKAYGK